jgi:hypothetical protein
MYSVYMLLHALTTSFIIEAGGVNDFPAGT